MTYIVYNDLVSKKRITTKNYGSFPFIKNEKVYFVSDPSFVFTKEEDPKFRQIKDYAIFEYNPQNQKTRKVIQLSGAIDIIGPK